MSDIPSELCYDILLRVPPVGLIRFRSVCKLWRSIIDDEGFFKAHSQGGDQLLIRTKSGKLYLLPLSAIDCSKNHTITVELANIKNLIRPGVSRILELPVSWNRGLVLLRPRYNQTGMLWTVWNPLTGESIQLPPHDDLTGDHRYSGGGIGYDSAADDFKVVMNAHPRGHASTIIYSLKLNVWKSIPNFKKQVCTYAPGVFVNGALHWITRPMTRPLHIVSLDLSTEEEHVLPRPSFLSEKQCLDSFHLDMLDGCLCLRNYRSVWIMKKYGENVWTELVSPEQIPNMKRPIAYFKGKNQVLVQLKTAELLLFDVEKKCSKKVLFEGVDVEGFDYQVCTSTHFRLNRSGGGDGSIAIRKRKRKTVDDRFEVELKICDVEDSHSSYSYH